MNLFLPLGGFFLLISTGIIIYILTPRRYQSSESVANSYDEWTEDGILEFYWGEHIHLGHYGLPTEKKTFYRQKRILSMKWLNGEA